MATIPMQFTATLSGTTLTLVVTSDPTFGSVVNNFDIILGFNSSLATFVSSTGGAGFLSAGALQPSGTVKVNGISDAGVAAGMTLATLVFTTKTTFSDFPLTLTQTGLNDALLSGTADPTVPCFAKGTMIATEHGETPVEELTEGDLVRTLDGTLHPIRWIGHRQVACGLHPLPHDVQPIRIQSGAIAEGLPARDLLLSPDHAILLDGALIPVRYLLNGATIVQERWSVVTYFHVELERHAVILAEGLPAETYLDSGNRAAFDGTVTNVIVLPGAALAIWHEKACAPLVFEGERLERARAALLSRAERLGHVCTQDHGLHIVVGADIVRPTRSGDDYSFSIPAGVASVRLCSRSFVPAHMLAGSRDVRLLGVAVAGIDTDGVGRPPETGEGWHAFENGLQWTTGNAVIASPGRRLVVRTCPLGMYRDTAPNPARPAIRAA